MGCGSSSNAEKAEAAEAGKAAEATQTAATYTVDGTTSKVGWKGFGVGHNHWGTIGLKEGSVAVEAGTIKAGKFVFDMKSIDAIDEMPADKKASLMGHLATGFFMSDSFPTSTFEITKVEALQNDANGNTHKISGNLTLKGATKELTFPAKVAINPADLATTATFKFDRTLWDVIENSKKNSKFDLKKYAANLVEDEVEMTLDIKAKKS